MFARPGSFAFAAAVVALAGLASVAATSCGSGGNDSTGAAGSGGGGGDGADGSTMDGGGDAVASNCGGNAISFEANGTARDSDAARSRIMVDLMSDLPINNANRTIEFWAYVRSTDWVGETNTMFEYGNQSRAAAGFGLDFGTFAVSGMADNHATLDPYTNGGFDGDSMSYLGITSADDQWVHFAMTWDGTAVRTYVNGVLGITVNATSTTMLATAQTQLTIGCNNPRFSCFGGLIDEFRVWNVARSDAEIMDSYNKALTGAEAGLVGYWKFDEAPGATMAADSVTTDGHTAHPGLPMATAAAMNPSWVTPPTPAPVLCP